VHASADLAWICVTVRDRNAHLCRIGHASSRRRYNHRAHVELCWLALLLIRIAETTCSKTWPALRRELDRMHVGTFTGPAGTFRQRTEVTKAQRDILAQLKIDPPPRIYQLTPASP
jgi:hypothetical protein